jgi:dTDP-4-amino-4,6-dideoxygalactose transaminase
MIQSNSFLPFALPEIGEEEINAVTNCLRSGWLTTGPATKQFEADFSAFLGKDINTISVNSASMGLLLAMEALGIGEGDEVIIPTYTFSATGMMAVHLGAKPVLIDIDPSTLNLNLQQIEKSITKKTKAIVPVHFAGLACDMKAINAIAKKHNLKVIEDAAHSLPATSNGKLIGDDTSDATVFSFYATKTITTGEGGMIATKSPEVANRCRVMRLHGISRDAFDRYTSKEVKWYYEIVAQGHKCNLTDLASSIGIVQLKKADRFQQRRQSIAEAYLQAFSDLPIHLPPKASTNDTHSWHLFIIRLKKEAKITRDNFIHQMGSLGVGCSVHFIPIHTHPYWQKKLGVKHGDFPVAEEVYNNAVSLPIYTKMTDADVQKVINAVKTILC